MVSIWTGSRAWSWFRPVTLILCCPGSWPLLAWPRPRSRFLLYFSPTVIRPWPAVPRFWAGLWGRTWLWPFVLTTVRSWPWTAAFVSVASAWTGSGTGVGTAPAGARTGTAAAVAWSGTGSTTTTVSGVGWGPSVFSHLYAQVTAVVQSAV